MNRDLWLLCKEDCMSQSELERQLHLLNRILHVVESWDQFCICNEIIHINRRKIIHKPYLMQALLKGHNRKPFVFVNCLN